jgi:3-carboxy-cis,cis-muconate cycloisomerase
MEHLADELELPVPEMPWHTERDRVVEIASAVGAVAAGMAKIATDIALLSQTEVGELSTGATALKGRSSTMPHKRNPVEATAALAAARLAVAMVPAVLAAAVQEHERSAGAWQAEWEAVPRLFCFAAGAVEWVVRALRDLRVDAARMRENLDGQRGMIMAEALTMALAPALGRQEAYRLVQRAADRAAEAGLSLAEAVRADEQISKAISAERLAAALDVTRYLGSAETFVDRALAGFRALEPADGRSRRRRT